jgi:hypothetical protein
VRRAGTQGTGRWHGVVSVLNCTHSTYTQTHTQLADAAVLQHSGERGAGTAAVYYVLHLCFADLAGVFSSINTLEVTRTHSG